MCARAACSARAASALLSAVASLRPLHPGVTPLHIAAWLGHSATVAALLEAGADAELACLEVRGAAGGVPPRLRLEMARLRGARVRLRLPSLAPALPHASHPPTPHLAPPALQGRTALAIACYFLDCRPKRSLGIISALLQHGADPLCSDFHGIGSLVLRWVLVWAGQGGAMG
jgi:ankyrin repeat protein